MSRLGPIHIVDPVDMQINQKDKKKCENNLLTVVIIEKATYKMLKRLKGKN